MKSRKKSWISSNQSVISRRTTLFFIGSFLALSNTLVSCSSSSNTASDTAQKQVNSSPSSAINISDKVTAKEVRIIRSKQLASLAVLEKQGILEKAFAPLGVTVEWLEFAAGPQQLEAINANGLDIASTAESPPIFAQAAGSDLVYLAATQTNGKPVALLVAKDSPIKSVAELKGKKIACQKASIGHYLLVKALEQAGLKITDVESVFLPPPDANVAFSQGRVDGWFIWDPFITRAEQEGIGRVLVDGEKLRDTRNFYLTSRKFYQENPQIIKVFLEELQKAELWTKDHPQETAQLLADVTKLEPKVLEKMHKKYEYGLYPITEAVIKKQEEVAALWYDLKLIPKKPDVRKGFLTPEEYAAFTPKEVLALKKSSG